MVSPDRTLGNYQAHESGHLLEMKRYHSPENGTRHMKRPRIWYPEDATTAGKLLYSNQDQSKFATEPDVEASLAQEATFKNPIRDMCSPFPSRPYSQGLVRNIQNASLCIRRTMRDASQAHYLSFDTDGSDEQISSRHVQETSKEERLRQTMLNGTQAENFRELGRQPEAVVGSLFRAHIEQPPRCALEGNVNYAQQVSPEYMEQRYTKQVTATRHMSMPYRPGAVVSRINNEYQMHRKQQQYGTPSLARDSFSLRGADPSLHPQCTSQPPALYHFQYLEQTPRSPLHQMPRLCDELPSGEDEIKEIHFSESFDSSTIYSKSQERSMIKGERRPNTFLSAPHHLASSSSGSISTPKRSEAGRRYRSVMTVDDARDINQNFFPESLVPLPKIRGRFAVPRGDLNKSYKARNSRQETLSPRKFKIKDSETIEDQFDYSDGCYKKFGVPHITKANDMYQIYDNTIHDNNSASCARDSGAKNGDSPLFDGQNSLDSEHLTNNSGPWNWNNKEESLFVSEDSASSSDDDSLSIETNAPKVCSFGSDVSNQQTLGQKAIPAFDQAHVQDSAPDALRINKGRDLNTTGIYSEPLSKLVGRGSFPTKSNKINVGKQTQQPAQIKLSRMEMSDCHASRKKQVYEPETGIQQSHKVNMVYPKASSPQKYGNSLRKPQKNTKSVDSRDVHSATGLPLRSEERVPAGSRQGKNQPLTTNSGNFTTCDDNGKGTPTDRNSHSAGDDLWKMPMKSVQYPPRRDSRRGSRSKVSVEPTISPSSLSKSTLVTRVLPQKPIPSTASAQYQCRAKSQSTKSDLDSIKGLPASFSTCQKKNVPSGLSKALGGDLQIVEETDQLRKQRDKEEVKRKKLEQVKMERQNREEQTARSKQRKKLLEEAESRGVALTEDVLNEEINAYIEKRKREIARRKENRARQQRIADFAPDTLMLESGGVPSLAKSDIPLSYGMDLEDREGDSPAILQFKRDARRSRDSRRSSHRRSTALSASAGSAKTTEYVRAAPKAVGNSTFYDTSSDSSHSSDEGDSDRPNISTSNSFDGGAASCFQVSSNNGRRGFEGNKRTDSDNEPKSMSSSTPVSLHGQSPSNLLDQSSLFFSSATEKAPAGDWVRFYQIQKQVVRKGVTQTEGHEDEIVCGVSLEGANNYAAALLCNYRSSFGLNVKVNECYTQNGHYKGTMMEGNGDATIFSVITLTKLSSTLDEVPMVNAIFLTNTIYTVHQSIKTTVVDVESSKTTISVTSEPVPGQNYTDRELANFKAAKYLIDFLKPKTSRMDDVLTYTNQVVPQIMRDRELFNDDGLLFSMDVEKCDGSWFEFDTLTIEVKLLQLIGPRN